MATKNKVCCVLCRKEITANNIKNHHNSKVCIAPKIQSEFNKDNSCMFCGKIYKNKLAISKHQPYCVRNPNRSDKPFRWHIENLASCSKRNAGAPQSSLILSKL